MDLCTDFIIPAKCSGYQVNRGNMPPKGCIFPPFLIPIELNHNFFSIPYLT